VTTNTVEGFFGIFKRGMVGVYQHRGEQHLQHYLDEFTFRYNTGKGCVLRSQLDGPPFPNLGQSCV
jgi:hypothetical protein